MPIGFLLRYILGTVRNTVFPSTHIFGFYVSQSWVNEQKNKYKGDDIDYVSTNDCLVSTFCNYMQCDVAISAINFRNRVKGCTSYDVGNYEDLMTYMKSNYESPALIRKSLSTCDKNGNVTYTRASTGGKTSMLTNAQHINGATYAAITNWSTFTKKPLKVHNDNWKQDLHIPLFDFRKNVPAGVMGSMIIFSPSENVVGVIVAGDQTLVDKVKLSDMVERELDVTL